MPHTPVSVDHYVAHFLAEPWSITPDDLDHLAVLLRPEPVAEPDERAA